MFDFWPVYSGERFRASWPSCFLNVYKLHCLNYFNTKYFYDSKANQAKYLTSLDVVFNDADIQSHYDLSNGERQLCKGTFSVH